MLQPAERFLTDAKSYINMETSTQHNAPFLLGPSEGGTQSCYCSSPSIRMGQVQYGGLLRILKIKFYQLMVKTN